MLTLYSKSSCAFCRQVFAVIDRLDLDVEIKDISENEAYATELLEKSGKQKVPYLVDTDNDVAMDESDDIVKHLQTTYGAPSKPRIHNAGAAVCVACEG